jgi:L-aminoadipate-semialdehyde dehydrogenase
MADDAEQQRLQRAVTKLKSVPSIALPMDYPRPTTNKLVEAVHSQELDSATSLSLLKLALYQDDSGESAIPTPFQLLLSAFVVLLHRYTGDSDLVIASSSAAAHDPLLLRVSIEPTDSFITIVRRVQQIQLDSEKDAAPFDKIVHALGADQEGSAPLFRVRFFDETDELPKSSFIRSTSLTSDLTVFVTRPQSSTSAHATLVPRLSLRISYNSLLFKSTRISLIVDQLSNFFQAISANPQNAIGTVPLLTPSQRLVLPNPTSNLNWCDWKGAITDIFSRNALAHPDKPCVVQSLPEKDANGNQLKRGYTYTDILHASNVLSHHLIKGGVAREDVVMIYAYRSVELVVAVMAVLKAGATFSVIGQLHRSFILLK